MNFLLKIVEGPNKGAEIALVSGVAVTLGKGDDCDIVLADPTLPSLPTGIEASDDSVAVDGEPLDAFAVKTIGATSFAVGPADAPWGELKWPEKGESPKPEAEAKGEGQEAKDGEGDKDDAPRASAPAPEEGAPQPEGGKRGRGGCLGCLVALALLFIALAVLAWFYRAAIRDFCKDKGYDVSSVSASLGLSKKASQVEAVTLASVAARYGLTVEEGEGAAKISGNLKTRAERLRATAEAYEAMPGVGVDISDDESFGYAASDALFTLTEGALKVLSATNRVLAIGGVSRSPEALKRTLEALNADLVKLSGIDASGVRFGIVPAQDTADSGRDDAQSVASRVSRPARKNSSSPSLPVCGILTKPYPCLVMRDGSRIMEGAMLGGNVILKIDADEVTVTNSAGRFAWKP